jgi:hypothetical protein
MLATVGFAALALPLVLVFMRSGAREAREPDAAAEKPEA